MHFMCLFSLFALPLVAAADRDWQSYILGPTSRTLFPSAILKSSAAGVQNADALLGNSAEPLRLSTDKGQARWPDGTTAAGSSTHDASNGRTYDAQNAIDGSTATFWNDNTEDDASGPDILTITAPSTVPAIAGLTIVSHVDGYIEDFTVETSTSGSWHTQANITGNTALAPYIQFPAPVSFTDLRITVTKNQNVGKRVFTRITEVVLGEFTGSSSWPAQTSATASSSHAGNNQHPSYEPSLVLDNDATTFWNDDTEGVFPDVLTVISGDAVVLPGITVVSHADGVVADFTVETTPDGETWTQQAAMKGNQDVTIPVAFSAAISVKGVRITVTAVQNAGGQSFSRIAEVLPRLAQPAPWIDLDFGQVIVGYLHLNIAAASDPAPQIRLAFSETQQYLGYKSDYSPSDYSEARGGTDDFVPSPAGGNWTDNRVCQFEDKTVCSDGLRGFRYLRIFLGQTPGAESHSSPTGWVEVAPSGLWLDFTPYLGTPDTYNGYFISSDDLLNKIWYASVYTVELNTDTFTADTIDPRNSFTPGLDGKIVVHDGAKRDRDPYVGDVAVQSIVDLVSHANKDGARNVLLDLAANQRDDGWMPPASVLGYQLFLFDYAAWWAIASGDFILWTGEQDFASTIWDALKKLMDTWYPSVTNAAGLFDKSGDWAGYGDYAFLPRNGVITYYNGNYVRALRSAALIATFLGHTDEASAWSSRADSVSAAIASSDLWDASVGAWRDSTGPSSACHSQDATAFAILSNSSTLDRAQSSLAYIDSTMRRDWGNKIVDADCFGGGISDRGYNFATHPEVMARFQVGDDAGALELIRRSWGWQITRDPMNTLWEGVGLNGEVSAYQGAFSSMAHGWAAGAAIALSTRVLGVEPTSPGFATYDVVPHPGDVTWANGTVPTPRGDITVGWTVVDGALKLDIHGPDDALARVRVPVASTTSRRRDAFQRQVLLNGEPVWQEGSVRTGQVDVSFDGDFVFIHGLAGGTHSILST
ncbi:Six-hairpin glycosidase [Exidia glandulosa HHB12029]|uniref:Six-hairpin glycosidase n=1 Tax=Exidia glandulosa HHB12029 TaxID=1314781 RepID=A0A165CJU4_EXIGL|nr:Six-hairpin glycosidase [Exidia glandulosa HHB12029]